MDVVAGLELGGATLVAPEGDRHVRGRLGRAVWSREQLLSDLELRLGLASPSVPEALRVSSWQRKLAERAPLGRFYSRSFGIDAFGTAQALLRLRDSLVEAGWEGQQISGGGERLMALRELECHGDVALPAGYVDRLRQVEHALGSFSHRVYEAIALAEPREQWPLRWQRVFGHLARAGTRVTLVQAELPGARQACDLQRIQAALASSRSSARIDGDGSFVLLTAETAWEAARATAAIVGQLDPLDTVVIRAGDGSALDHAFAAQGMPSQGLRSKSPWRAALQVLPLALELSFEPKDPDRVLELVTLPGGPFQGHVGRRLAYAIARSPAVGSPAWERAKAALLGHDANAGAAQDALERARSEVERIAAWFEAPAADPSEGAPKEKLIAVVERVHSWLLTRIAAAPDEGTLLAAAHFASALRAALTNDPSARLDLLTVRKLTAAVMGDGTAERTCPEQSGRVEHVARPGGVYSARKNLVWWLFADIEAQPPRTPWRSEETVALAAQGIHFPDARARLLERSKHRRRALRCATERVILVAPRVGIQRHLAPDPLWDELVARAGLSDVARRRITLEARALLDPTFASPLLPAPKRQSVAPLPLPGGHPEWTISAGALRREERFAPTELSALVGCPLKWVLSKPAALRSEQRDLPRLHQLAGTLGHRLVEVLHQQRAFSLGDETLRQRAEGELALLIKNEGAVLSRPGMTFERTQLTTQLVSAMVELSRVLCRSGLSIVAVEQSLSMAWRGGQLDGRIDLLVAGRDGAEYILDLKYGASSYRQSLVRGHAVQLAAYVCMHAKGRTALPEAAYFSLKQAALLGLAPSALPLAEAIRGRSLADTWQGVERSVDAVEAAFASGRVPVSGLRRSLPLLTTLGVAPSEQARFVTTSHAACDYCDFDALCGRRWEVGHGA